MGSCICLLPMATKEALYMIDFKDFMVTVGPFIMALCVLIGTWYTVRSQKPKVDSGVAGDAVAASHMALEDLREELARLNFKMAAQLLQMTELRITSKRQLELTARLLQGITVLLDQLHVAGLAPAWLPDPEIERLVKLATDDSDRQAIPRVIIPPRAKDESTDREETR